MCFLPNTFLRPSTFDEELFNLYRHTKPLSYLLSCHLEVPITDIQIVYHDFCGEPSVYLKGEWFSYLNLCFEPANIRAKKRKTRPTILSWS